MKLSKLFLYIAVAIIGFWLLGFALKLALWAMDVALIIGLTLVIFSLINKYYEDKKSGPIRKKIK